MTRQLRARYTGQSRIKTPLVIGWALIGAFACQSRPEPEVRREPDKPAVAQSQPGASPTQAARVEDRAKYETEMGGGATAVERAPRAAQPGVAAGAPPLQLNKAEPTQGAIVSDEAFSTWLQAASPAAAGAPTHVEAVLVAKAPYHCNAEYPHKFKLNAAPGFSYPEETVRGMQVTPERGVLRIPIQAGSAGLAKVSGTLSFSVCTDERCLVEKRDLALNLEVR